MSRAFYQIFIDVTGVQDLTTVTTSKTSFTFGAAATLSDIVQACHEGDPNSPLFTNSGAGFVQNSTYSSTYSALASHILQIANIQVRNAGSWAGNFMMATHHHSFPSDIVLVCVMYALYS